MECKNPYTVNAYYAYEAKRKWQTHIENYVLSLQDGQSYNDKIDEPSARSVRS